MDSITLLREQLRGAHEYLEETMADVTPELAQWIPAGKATPLGANYIHLVQTEDQIINQALRQRELIAESMGVEKIGISEMMPTPPWTAEDYMGWSRRVELDLPAFREYAQAVYAATDAYVATLTPEELDAQADLSSLGMSPVTLGWALTRYIVGHTDNICGEVSCLKGLQGATGYAE